MKRIIIAVALFTTAHGVSLFAGSGEIVDEATMKPLAGVFVFATWRAKGWNPVHSSTVCYDFAITLTNEKGKFTLPAFSWNPLHAFGRNQRSEEYYLAGYELSPRYAHGLSTVLMRRVVSSTTERLGRIAEIRPGECVSPGNYKLLVPLYRAQNEEAQRIATTPSEKKLASNFIYRIRDAETARADGIVTLPEEMQKP